jgi:hypothetical protein
LLWTFLTLTSLGLSAQGGATTLTKVMRDGLRLAKKIKKDNVAGRCKLSVRTRDWVWYNGLGGDID